LFGGQRATVSGNRMRQDATVRPGVVRSPGGGLVISAAGEHPSALIVNSADVTDPATGQFGLTVPIDSVETLNVYQAPFQAEYGRFTAGLVSVETRRGGDKWKWELNDPFPPADLPNRFLAWGLLQLPWGFQNLTNHFNPEAFHNNVADPAYGLFFGQGGRRFTADFDVIF
jgi:hypothetical protein